MEKLFNPRSVAIIGASHHKEKLGYQILENLLLGGYKGNVYPVNPESGKILNLNVFPGVLNINEEIDLAVIVVPAKFVPQVLTECSQKNVSFAVIVSSGFSETGKEGALMQGEIKEVVIGASAIRVVGPNCLGVFNTTNGLNATFAAPKLIKGKVSAVLQSGALGVALFDWAEKYGFGFAKFVSLGNKIDLEEAEIIEYLANDEETKIIAVYLEDVHNPAKFLKACSKASKKKPIVILKGGMTDRGAKAAFSHTAAMVSSRKITKAIFKQSNLIMASSIQEMLTIIQLLNTEAVIASPNLAIVTNAGGPGILATDEADQAGLNIANPSEKESKELQKLIPQAASLANPFDLGGEAKADDYKKALNIIINSNNFSSVLTILTPQTATEINETAQMIVQFAKAKKPVITSFLGDKTISDAKKILRDGGIPNVGDLQLAVQALAKISRYWQKRDSKEYLIELEKQSNPLNLSGDQFDLIRRYNIPVPESALATNLDVAQKALQRIGFPVAVKNVSNSGIHKFRAGKVILGIQNQESFEAAIKKVGFPVLVQKMVNAPFEVIVGAKRDPKMGVIITFGWGGVFVEDLSDISLRILPLTECDLDEMIKETKIGKILVRENVNLSPIKNIMIEVAQIMTDYPEIEEMDLNPLKVSQDEAIVVDVRYKLEN